jgi:hypothetical protein
LALVLVVPVACSGGGGEAEQKSDSQDEDDAHGAPGEDADGDAADSTDAEDDAGGQPGEGASSDDAEATAGAQSAYVDYQTMFERLVIDPDSDDAEIAERTSGAELDHVVGTLTDFESRNQAVEFGTLHKHNVYDVKVDAAGNAATVLDCFVSDARVVNATSRRILRGDPEGGTASLVTATVVRSSDGTWRVDATSATALASNEGCGATGVIHRGT